MRTFTVPINIIDYDKYEIACIIGAIMAGYPTNGDPDIGFVSTPYIISYHLCGGTADDNTIRNIKKGLATLGSKNALENINSGHYYFSPNNQLLNIYGNYIILQRSDIHKLMTADLDRVDKFCVLQHYIELLSTMGNSYRSGFMSVEYISKKFNRSDTSVSKYNKILCELGLITFVRGYICNKDRNTWISKTAYCRPNDTYKAKMYLTAKGYKKIKEANNNVNSTKEKSN